MFLSTQKSERRSRSAAVGTRIHERQESAAPGDEFTDETHPSATYECVVPDESGGVYWGAAARSGSTAWPAARASATIAASGTPRWIRSKSRTAGVAARRGGTATATTSMITARATARGIDAARTTPRSRERVIPGPRPALVAAVRASSQRRPALRSPAGSQGRRVTRQFAGPRGRTHPPGSVDCPYVRVARCSEWVGPAPIARACPRGSPPRFAVAAAMPAIMAVHAVAAGGDRRIHGPRIRPEG